jgi:CheY-like chemotaxis protein
MEAKPLAGRHILLLEDEMMILLMMEEMLIDLGGATVTSAATVGQALSKLDGEVFDAAVLDVNLNGTRSYPVAERLAACGIPFVFSTGYSDDALGDGYADRPVLKKPFQYPELASALSRLLAGHQ